MHMHMHMRASFFLQIREFFSAAYLARTCCCSSTVGATAIQPNIEMPSNDRTASPSAAPSSPYAASISAESSARPSRRSSSSSERMKPNISSIVRGSGGGHCSSSSSMAAEATEHRAQSGASGLQPANRAYP